MVHLDRYGCSRYVHGMPEIRTLADAVTADAIVTATCNNPKCGHSDKLDLWSIARVFGDQLDLGHMRRKLRCKICGSGAIIAVLPKDWGNLQSLWKGGAKPGGSGI